MRATINTTKYIDHDIKITINTEYSVIDKYNQEINIINIYPQVKYQEIIGFGGAITEAVGATLNKVPESVALEVMENYFGPSGLCYRFVRTHMDSCDFSLSNYSAVEDPEDINFNTFSLRRDEKNILPFIKYACEAAKEALPIMLTPWSPPAFMKTNGDRNNGGKLKKEYYSAWAKYICKYINEYKKRGAHVKMLSIQNEPNAVQTWDSCEFEAEDEKLFLKDYLYPAVIEMGLFDLEIYIWDHNKEKIYERATTILDQTTQNMVAGLAFHWYSGDHFDGLRLVRDLYPDKKLLFSEGCIEYSRFDCQQQLSNAQMYAHDMIGNFNNGMNIFIDWNIMLDEVGGPNHKGNFCEAPIICNTKTGELQKKLSFYYIGHFSKYFQPGARRVATTQFTDQLELTAVENPDETIAIAIMNKTTTDQKIFLRIHEQLIQISIERESMNTIVVDLKDI